VYRRAGSIRRMRRCFDRYEKIEPALDPIDVIAEVGFGVVVSLLLQFALSGFHIEEHVFLMEAPVVDRVERLAER